MGFSKKNVNPKEIGGRIKALRLAKGITQETLAELSDLSTPYISHLENGHKYAGLGVMAGISAALGTTVDFLLTGKYLPEENNSSEFQQLLVDCSPQEVKIICDIAAAAKTSIRKNI